MNFAIAALVLIGAAGSGHPGNEITLDDGSYKATFAASSCAVRAAPKASRQLAAAYPGSADEKAALADKRIARCLSIHGVGQSYEDMALFAGEVARLDNEDYRYFHSYGDLPKVSHLPISLHGTEGVSVVAACVVSSDPNSAYKLMIAEIGSKTAHSLLSQAQGTLNQCLDYHNTIRFEKDVLHAEIDRAFFRYINRPENLWPK